MNIHRRRHVLQIAGIGAVLALVLWLVLPLFLPELALTQRPNEYAESVTPAPVPVSHASLPIELPLDVLEARLTRELDASLAKGREDNDFRVWRNGALRLRATDQAVRLSLPLRFKSKAGPDTKGELVVRTRITAGIAPDWRPKVSVHSTFDWTKKPKVRILSVKVRVSGVVGRAIQKKLRELDADLREEIESALTLKPRAEDWWRDLHEPRMLSDDPPIWLTVQPERMFFEPIGGNDRALRLMLGIRARLSTTLARQPEPLPPTALPPLHSATADDQGFAVFLPVLADYRGLTAEMQKELIGQEIRLEQGAITPTGFELYTSGRNLVVGVDFKGDAPGFWLDTRGTVYFTGEPRFDPRTRVLRIENFHFTRRLNNPLVSTASWALQDSLRQQMQQRLVWNLAGRLEAAADDLSGLLNKPLGENLRLEGQVEDLNLTGVQCLAEGIYIGLETRGRLKVTLAASGQGPG